ncbi:TonB-dependent receptor domain-containing protein [Aquisediminimonas profunda]|uniref:TonB-dependent receptor domain-containing protein n=1 Tax=Aquisediminimonas profunda TaxID=1550733 RepID=UPI001C624A48|nr:TonB-dependent receptor [Aquisediminimonas profunda]
MKTQKFYSRARLSAGVASAVIGFAMLATPAFAQEAANEEDSGDIIVTGSRIPQPNLEGISPVTSVNAQDIKLSGTVKAEDLLNSLPQVFAAQSSTLSNGATGTATVDLRGLGSSRTLVLINGRRLMTGDPNSTSSAADLNFIPTQLVKRVDVLTGGASATYGADAVAGVVNFIMDTDFEGFRVDANYGFYQHNNRNKITPPLLNARAAAGFSGYGYPTGSVADGGTFDGSVSFGGKFGDDRGHFTAYVGYRKAKPVLQSNRDYSACTVQVNDRLAGGFTPNSPLQCGGSATSATGTAFYFVTSTTSSTVGALGPGTLTQGTLNRYNFAPTNYFQRPDERYTAGAFVDYEISDAVKPYMEFMFMDDRTLAQIAPSGDFGNTLTVNCDNPLMSASQLSQICNPGNLINTFIGNFPVATNAGYNPLGNILDPNDPAFVPPIAFPNSVPGAANGTYNKAFFQLLRRNVEGGPRINDLQHTAFRTVIGTKGDLGKGWAYDAYYQYGRTNYSQVYRNEFSVARLTRALDVVDDPRVAGIQAVCRSALDGTDPNCVPYDIFGGTPSAASLAYLNATGFLKGQTSQQVLSGSLTGDLGEYGFKTPWSDDGVALALGVEYRKDSLELNADNAFQTGDLTGQGAPTLDVAGNYKVKEVLGEIEVPIVRDSFIKNLTFNGGIRHSSYKLSSGRSISTDTYKLALDFSPVSDIRFRGTYNRAVRVPNIQELFAPQFVGLDGSTDPCAGTPITAAQVGCLAQGLSLGQGVTANPAAQYNGLLGGNPNLLPEIATTKTLGAVFTPRFIPGFSMTLDWFDIKIKKAIQGYGADAILTACGSGNLTACGLINRDPAGSLWLTSNGYVQDLQTNVGSFSTRGLEINGNYSREIGSAGTVSLSLIGTLLDTYKVDNGLTEIYDCAGYFGPTCGTPAPKWRHKARVSFNAANGLGMSLQWRYFGSVDAEYKNPSQTLNGNVYDYNSSIAAQSYFDLALTAKLGDRFRFQLGVNNLLDRQPPVVHSGSGNFGQSNCASTVCNGNSYPGTYDSLGRYIYSGITLDF